MNPTIKDPCDPPAMEGLIFVSDEMPGIGRHRRGKGFSYRDADGSILRDRNIVKRIQMLAIPPAYNDVWICALENGHLQATGRDARGRKQYRYHPDFRAWRDSEKFSHLIAFARSLPAIRAQVAKDMALRGLPREKVLATIVHLLDISMIRVGNADYARQNNSFGLTTLRRRHAALKGESLRLRFKGKSGKPWDITIRDRRVARLLKSMQELPGQHLFQYVDADGAVCEVMSHDVNAYLKAIRGDAITAKDFRTWHGTVLAATALADTPPGESATATKRSLVAVIDAVAARLGNTRTICRTCYIHPAVIDAYVNADLRLRIRAAQPDDEAFSPAEHAVLAFLQRTTRKRSAP